MTNAKGKSRSVTSGRYVAVSSAQRSAARAIVAHGARTGRDVSPSVRKIAEAK